MWCSNRKTPIRILWHILWCYFWKISSRRCLIILVLSPSSCIPSKSWDSAASLYWKNTSWLQPLSLSGIKVTYHWACYETLCPSFALMFIIFLLNRLGFQLSNPHCWFPSMNVEYVLRKGHLREQTERMWGHNLNREAHGWKYRLRENDTILETRSNDLQLCGQSLVPTRMLLGHSKVWSLLRSTSLFSTDEHNLAQQLPFQNSFSFFFPLKPVDLYIQAVLCIQAIVRDVFLRDDFVLRKEHD